MKKIILYTPALVALLSCSANNDSNKDSAAKTFGQSQDSVSIAETNIEWPRINNPIAVDPVLENRITSIIAEMELEDKVGQMIQAEIRSITPEEVKQYRIGSILNGGGTTPNNDKHATAKDWVALADSYYEASMDISDGGVAIPIIWGSDAVHGHNNVIGATLFPHNIGLGAANDPDMIKAIAEATAREVAATGIDWIFAPTLAVSQDDLWGRTYESYSENPDIVAAYAPMIIQGLQGQVNTETFLDSKHSIATAKHFLGDGGTTSGIDQGNNIDGEEKLRDIHAAGYFPALEAGTQTVMASYNSWNGEKLHGHHYLLQTVLKDHLGFDGFVVGDWNGHGQLPGCDNTQCAAAINSGLDMFMVPQDWKALFENTVAQVKSGEISLDRIDDAVRRILRVKLRAGIFERGKPSNRPLAGKQDLIGAAAHRDLAREAARKTLVLLKNNNEILPLDRKQKILVVGDAANNMGKQTGGWTISWQGTGNENADFPGGSTILKGIQEIVSQAGGEVIFSENGEGIDSADVVIAVFGESPYAEMHGDISTYEYQPGNKIDLALLDKFKSQNIPIVSIFLSGRPLWVNPELNRSDAFVAAWLPGSEGRAIADVIFKDDSGNINFNFHGKLSFSWPRSPNQRYNLTDNNSGNSSEPLFPWGYGLDYKKTQHIAGDLNETGAAPSPASADSVILLGTKPQIPWQLFLHEDSDNSIKIRSDEVSGLFHTITVTEIEERAGYKKVEWTGERKAEVYLATNSPMNFSSYSVDGILKFSLQLNQKLTGNIELAMSCGEECNGGIDITSWLSGQAIDEWSTISVALKCFTNAGLIADKVTTGFSIASNENSILSFGNVQLQNSGADTATIKCD